MTNEDRPTIEKAVASAQDQFWAQIVADFPHIKTGDFPPDATIALTEAMTKAVTLWLDINGEKD